MKADAAMRQPGSQHSLAPAVGAASTAPDGETQGPDRFRLLRHFSFASLISIVAAAALLGAGYRYAGVNDLLQIGERGNVALAQAFAKAHTPE